MRRLAAAGLIAAAMAATPAFSREGPARSAEQAEAQADQEFARDDYAAAEAHYREAIAMRPDSVRATSRLALLMTWKGKYREAIDLYQKALALEPSALETRRGLATAYTWSEDYPRALSLYREMLRDRPGDEGISFEMAQAQAWSGDLKGSSATLHGIVERNARNVKARLLLAQVHLWSGELVDAEKIYRSLIAEQPSNVDALNGLGKVLATQGRYEEALASYDRALSVDPKSRGALEGRAEVYHWQGRTPEALAAVRQALDLYPDARDARRLGRDIGGALRPSLQIFGTTTQDTDDNDLGTWGAIYTHHLGGKGYVGLSYTHAQTSAQIGADPNGMPPASTPVARYDTARVIAAAHFSSHVSLYGEAGGERTSYPFDIFGANDERTKSHPAGSLTLEINGAEWFTLVASGSQERLVGTTQAFMNDVGIRAGTLTTYFRPHPSVRLWLSGQKATFMDDPDHEVGSDFAVTTSPRDARQGNGRDLARAGASWRLPLGRPRITLSYNLRWMSYDHNVDHGYFDPDRFVSQTAGFDVSDAIGKAFYWGGGADAGYQTIDRNDPDNTFSYRLLAGINIGQSTSIEAYYSRSDLAVQTAAGFRSTEAGVRMRFRFGQSLGPAAPHARAASGRDGSSD